MIVVKISSLKETTPKDPNTKLNASTTCLSLIVEARCFLLGKVQVPPKTISIAHHHFLNDLLP
jgi:hypothetical protein